MGDQLVYNPDGTPRLTRDLSVRGTLKQPFDFDQEIEVEITFKAHMVVEQLVLDQSLLGTSKFSVDFVQKYLPGSPRVFTIQVDGREVARHVNDMNLSVGDIDSRLSLASAIW